jgi:Domain of unknown function (DUF3846)
VRIVHADGRTTHAGPRRPVTLAELQRIVGGYIEPVPGTACRAWCNEHGLLEHLPENAEASRLFGMRLVGDVVILEAGDTDTQE